MEYFNLRGDNILKRDNIANLLNQQILLEELEKKEGKKIEEENNKSKILIFVEFIGLILEFIFCFFQLIFYIILLVIIIGIFYAIF